MIDTMKRMLAAALSLALAAMAMPAEALADVNPSYWYNAEAIFAKPVAIDDTLIKTYGVRAGSAGPDFLGITNTNFDFSAAGAVATEQYVGFSAADLVGVKGAGLAIWGTNVNESCNPYYANLMYNRMSNGLATEATTWSANPDGTSWGDSYGLSSKNEDYESTINGLEFSPQIIFGANKRTSWGNFDPSSTVIGQYAATHEGYNPTFVNNDATNLWTQVYTLGQLGATADSLKAGTNLTTRYDGNSATRSALNYEKALRGNLLYVASQIDAGKVKRKKVAYLYCVSGGTGYFFTPQASGLMNGDDTGKENARASIPDQVRGADANYAANNATIDLGYMGALPFVTDTFDGGEARPIVMQVEDIYKSNPAVAVDLSQDGVLSDVDVIVYNTTTQTDLNGTSGGKNSSGVGSGASYGHGGAMTLTDSSVRTWASQLGFHGALVAGDDWGTSTNQGFGVTPTTEEGMAPLLYCQRNYTCDKPARAAWAFARVYPELYPNPDASYAYWVDKVYHVRTEWVPDVVKYMTNQSDGVTYTSATARAMEQRFDAGLAWWLRSGSRKAEWSRFAYYNGSSRASYYDGRAASEEPTDSIGIFTPSSVWVNAAALTDFTALDEALAAAGASLSGVAASPDGEDVDAGARWAGEAVLAALRDAIAEARAVAGNAGAMQDEIDAAAAALLDARDAFEAGVRLGSREQPGAGTVREGPPDAVSDAPAVEQKLKVSSKPKVVKYAKVRKSAQKVTGAIRVKGAKTALSYSLAGAVKAKSKGSFKKRFSVSGKGVVTVRKGTGKGTYKLSVKVSAKASGPYKKASVTKTVTIKVR